jgi:hypothetical protein
MRSFLIYTLHQIKQNQMVRTCNKHGSSEKCGSETLQGRYNLVGLGIDGKIILKRILNKWNVN